MGKCPGLQVPRRTPGVSDDALSTPRPDRCGHDRLEVDTDAAGREKHDGWWSLRRRRCYRSWSLRQPVPLWVDFRCKRVTTIQPTIPQAPPRHGLQVPVRRNYRVQLPDRREESWTHGSVYPRDHRTKRHAMGSDRRHACGRSYQNSRLATSPVPGLDQEPNGPTPIRGVSVLDPIWRCAAASICFTTNQPLARLLDQQKVGSVSLQRFARFH